MKPGGWSVGDRAWFVERRTVLEAEVHALDPFGLVGVADETEPRGVAWFDEGNVFETEQEATAARDAWKAEERS